MTPEPRARPGAPLRALQCVAAGTSLALLSALVLGASAPDGRDAAPVARAGHHGTVLPDPTPAPADATDGAAAAAGTVTLAPGTKIGADGRVVHDHGDLEVTVMLAADGGTEVLGPVRPGASLSFVNHTTSDQVLTTADGTLRVDVPLVRLVTLPAPRAPGTYRLVSRTDRTVTADVVVTADPVLAGPGTTATDAAAVVTAVDDRGPADPR